MGVCKSASFLFFDLLPISFSFKIAMTECLVYMRGSCARELWWWRGSESKNKKTKKQGNKIEVGG